MLCGMAWRGMLCSMAWHDMLCGMVYGMFGMVYDVVYYMIWYGV